MKVTRSLVARSQNPAEQPMGFEPLVFPFLYNTLTHKVRDLLQILFELTSILPELSENHRFSDDFKGGQKLIL